MRRAITVLAATLLSGNAHPPGERVVDGDGIIVVGLDGRPIRLRVDPAAPGMPLLSEDFAKQRGFRTNRSLGIGYGFRIGPTTVMSRTRVASIDYGDKPSKQRIGWTRRPFAVIADGSVGPGGLPESIVRFALRPLQPGERTITMRMERPGFTKTLFGDGWAPSIGVIDVAGTPMRIRFDPHHPRTLATAGAAARLAEAYGGTLSGAATPTEIFFGVERPVRGMTLDRPLAIGPLSIDRLGVRVGDFGGTDAIPDADRPSPASDPDEIVVTARGRKRDARHDTVSIGADQLSQCSSIVFDKTAQEIRLSCSDTWATRRSARSPSSGHHGRIVS
ncbi:MULTISPECIES: hypothetical protein [Alphaproteobacteria]|uniref:hypothetical protein n=1 Tax=Alphaproteobacteria TaxID=28211 RepID=UPI002619CC0D|nr:MULTISPECIES: hypothetical protein [Alphaproteobacteria]